MSQGYTTRSMELSSKLMERVEDHRRSVLVLLILRCLFDIQMEMLIEHLDIYI